MSDPAEGDLARSVVRAPHPRLRGLASAYHGYRYTVDAPAVHHGLPDTSLTVVFAFDRFLDLGWFREPEARQRHWAVVSGMSAEPAAIYSDGLQHGIQLDLTPAGARALLGLPAAALSREIVPLSDVLGSAAARLYDDLAVAPTWPDRFAALDRHLIALAGRRQPDDVRQDAVLAHAWALVHQTAGRLPVAALASDVGWSRRQLSHRFRAEFGITAKQGARLVRFAAARQLLLGHGCGLAEVAARCGYADQAHLSREWRDLAGAAPTRWLREERPFLQDSAAQL